MNTGVGTGDVGPWGYGAELIPMFDSREDHVYNAGKGGRSSRGYREEGLWERLLARMTPGDWVLMQFGHNDAANSQNYPDRISGKGNGDELSEVTAPGGKKTGALIRLVLAAVCQRCGCERSEGRNPIACPAEPVGRRQDQEGIRRLRAMGGGSRQGERRVLCGSQCHRCGPL